LEDVTKASQKEFGKRAILKKRTRESVRVFLLLEHIGCRKLQEIASNAGDLS